jgi:Rrf2 family protein
MKLNTKTRYGIRTLIEIANYQNEGGVLQKDIAERQNLSVKYLDQIIRALKERDLVSTVRGRKSGYQLNREASQITVYDIYLAFESDLCIVDCISENVTCALEEDCKSKSCWGNLNKVIMDYLSGVTLEDVIKSPYCVDSK